MIVVPAIMPVRMPAEDPIVATNVLLLLQVPPVIPSVRLMVAPEHTVEGPIIAVGAGVTAIVVVVTQLPGMV
jgi:hypothetical protein